MVIPAAIIVMTHLLFGAQPAAAEKSPLQFIAGIRLEGQFFAATEFPRPPSIRAEQWRSQEFAGFTGIDAGVARDKWALLGHIDYAGVEHRCDRVWDVTYDPGPSPYPTNHQYLGECEGQRWRAGALAQYVAELQNEVQGVVGVGAAWIQQSLYFKERTQYREEAWITSEQTDESQGLELTLLAVELRWPFLRHLWLGPTSSVSWIDDSFGSRYSVTGGVRLGYQ